MVDPAGNGPIVRIPQRIDRRARLGPFPSARDALRFLCYAAAGAVVSSFASPYLWLPVVAGGFAVSIWQPDGRPADERALHYLLWRFRSVVPRRSVTGTDAAEPRHGFYPVAPGAYIAVVRSSGTPIAYLPPRDLELKFDQYREVLRGLSGAIAILSTTVPIRGTEVRPTDGTGSKRERDARDGYAELVDRLCRRRRVRRVYLALRNAETGTDSLARLEGEVRTLTELLTGLGVRSTRLEGRELAEAACRMGWDRRVRGAT
jgi:hypothetical protein